MMTHFGEGPAPTPGPPDPEFGGTRHDLAIALDELGDAHREAQTLRQLLDAASDQAFVATDADGRITTWSTGAEQLFGMTADEAEGHAIEVVFAGDPEMRLPWNLRQAPARRSQAVERWLVRRDGSSVFVRGTFTAVTDECGALASFLLTLRDQTGEERQRRHLLARLVAAQEDERLRIAMDLHDGIGQEVTAVGLLLETLRLRRDGPGFDDAFRAVQEALAGLDRELHQLTWALRPARREHEDLPAMVAAHVRTWSERCGVTADLRSTVPPEVRLDRDAEQAVYRIVQEALNNVCRHARATRVHVALALRAGELIVTVADDGVGFEPGAPPRGLASGRGGSCGLLGMRDRAELLQASIDVHSAPGHGTCVTLRVPLGAPGRRRAVGDRAADRARRHTDIRESDHEPEPADADRPHSQRVPRNARPAADLRTGLPALADRRALLQGGAPHAGA